MQNNNRLKKEYILLFAFFFVGMLLYFIGIPIPCVFHKLTGLSCPGCGITRMFASIIKFDFVESFRYNPVCFIYLIIAIIYICLRTVLKLDFSKKTKNVIYIIAIIILLLFGIVRNLPIF